jgi:hypothetical protein
MILSSILLESSVRKGREGLLQERRIEGLRSGGGGKGEEGEEGRLAARSQ